MVSIVGAVTHDTVFQARISALGMELVNIGWIGGAVVQPRSMFAA